MAGQRQRGKNVAFHTERKTDSKIWIQRDEVDTRTMRDLEHMEKGGEVGRRISSHPHHHHHHHHTHQQLQQDTAASESDQDFKSLVRGRQSIFVNQAEIGATVKHLQQFNASRGMGNVALRPTKRLKLELGKLLTKCLADVATHRPHDPIEYMAHWLYKHVDAELYFYQKVIFNQECMMLVLDLQRRQTKKQSILEAINYKMKELKTLILSSRVAEAQLIAEKVDNALTKQRSGLASPYELGAGTASASPVPPPLRIDMDQFIDIADDVCELMEARPGAGHSDDSDDDVSVDESLAERRRSAAKKAKEAWGETRESEPEHMEAEGRRRQDLEKHGRNVYHDKKTRALRYSLRADLEGVNNESDNEMHPDEGVTMEDAKSEQRKLEKGYEVNKNIVENRRTDHVIRTESGHFMRKRPNRRGKSVSEERKATSSTASANSETLPDSVVDSLQKSTKSSAHHAKKRHSTFITDPKASAGLTHSKVHGETANQKRKSKVEADLNAEGKRKKSRADAEFDTDSKRRKSGYEEKAEFESNVNDQIFNKRPSARKAPRVTDDITLDNIEQTESASSIKSNSDTSGTDNQVEKENANDMSAEEHLQHTASKGESKKTKEKLMRQKMKVGEDSTAQTRSGENIEENVINKDVVINYSIPKDVPRRYSENQRRASSFDRSNESIKNSLSSASQTAQLEEENVTQENADSSTMIKDGKSHATKTKEESPLIGIKQPLSHGHGAASTSKGHDANAVSGNKQNFYGSQNDKDELNQTPSALPPNDIKNAVPSENNMTGQGGQRSNDDRFNEAISRNNMTGQGGQRPNNRFNEAPPRNNMTGQGGLRPINGPIPMPLNEAPSRNNMAGQDGQDGLRPNAGLNTAPSRNNMAGQGGRNVLAPKRQLSSMGVALATDMMTSAVTDILNVTKAASNEFVNNVTQQRNLINKASYIFDIYNTKKGNQKGQATEEKKKANLDYKLNQLMILREGHVEGFNNFISFQEKTIVELKREATVIKKMDEKIRKKEAQEGVTPKSLTSATLIIDQEGRNTDANLSLKNLDKNGDLQTMVVKDYSKTKQHSAKDSKLENKTAAETKTTVTGYKSDKHKTSAKSQQSDSEEIREDDNDKIKASRKTAYKSDKHKTSAKSQQSDGEEIREDDDDKKKTSKKSGSSKTPKEETLDQLYEKREGKIKALFAKAEALQNEYKAKKKVLSNSTAVLRQRCDSMRKQAEETTDPRAKALVKQVDHYLATGNPADHVLKTAVVKTNPSAMALSADNNDTLLGNIFNDFVKHQMPSTFTLPKTISQTNQSEKSKKKGKGKDIFKALKNSSDDENEVVTLESSENDFSRDDTLVPDNDTFFLMKAINASENPSVLRGYAKSNRRESQRDSDVRRGSENMNENSDSADSDYDIEKKNSEMKGATDETTKAGTSSKGRANKAGGEAATKGKDKESKGSKRPQMEAEWLVQPDNCRLVCEHPLLGRLTVRKATRMRPADNPLHWEIAEHSDYVFYHEELYTRELAPQIFRRRSPHSRKADEVETQLSGETKPTETKLTKSRR